MEFNTLKSFARTGGLNIHSKLGQMGVGHNTPATEQNFDAHAGGVIHLQRVQLAVQAVFPEDTNLDLLERCATAHKVSQTILCRRGVLEELSVITCTCQSQGSVSNNRGEVCVDTTYTAHVGSTEDYWVG